MNEFWQSTISSVVGGFIGAGGGLWAITKLIIEKKLNRLDQISNAQVQLQTLAATDQIQHKLNIFPTLSQLIYKAKNEAQISLKQGTKNYCSPSLGLRECCRELVTNLYSYRIYLSSDTFRAVHDYKNQLQDVLNDMDWLSRPHEPSPDDLVLAHTFTRIETGVRSLTSLCDTINNDLQKQLNNLQGELRPP